MNNSDNSKAEGCATVLLEQVEEEKFEIHMQLQKRRIKKKKRVQTDAGDKLYPREEALTAHTRITIREREH